MARPLLPLGNKAPWVLLGLAAFLVGWGFVVGNAQMMTVGGVAAALWLLAFPLAHLLLGSDEEPPEQP